MIGQSASRCKIHLIVLLSFAVLFSSCLFGQQVNAVLTRTSLENAIKESNPPEAARLLEILLNAGVDPKTLPLTDVADLVINRVSHAYQWEAITGGELVQLFRPLEGLFNNTWRGNEIRAAHFWGLMATGEQKKALRLWRQSENAIDSVLAKPYRMDVSKLPTEELALLQSERWAIWFYVLGFVSSENGGDKLRGVELARRHYDWVVSATREEVKGVRVTYPAAQPRLLEILCNAATALYQYSLFHANLAASTTAHPFAKEQAPTNIHFQKLQQTGFEECAQQVSVGNVLVLGDYDGDTYVDVLIPGHGLWRNLGGTGVFKRVDKELGAYVDGPFGAFADVNNDGLMDIIIAGPRRFEVSLQTWDRAFRRIQSASDSVAENPGGIGLFDGDADGFIDVFLSGYEKGTEGGSTKALVLRNKGDGTFQNVTEAWGFSRDDIMLCGRGVSPGDYDNDGLTDLYVSNYRLNRNTMWHNVSEKGKPGFVQCASAPWFGRGERPEVAQEVDRGVEGWRGTAQNKSYWGHSIGSAWGDLNGDGTLDLISMKLAHPRNIRRGISDISRVYLNTGSQFNDHTVGAGLVFCETNANPLLADFNNDGILDLSVTNVYRIYVNQLYQGVGDGSFRDVTFRTGALAANSLAQAAGDFDNDGDLDWFVIDGNDGVLVYENTIIKEGKAPPNANWIQIKLEGGKRVNGMAFGARVTVKADNRTYVREVAGLRGFSNGDDPIVHIGLGSYSGPVDVEIRWISNKSQRITGLMSGRRHRIHEADTIE